ncbi:hypothetical protein SDC9_112913 [bioreactor metagenome]|uniref:Uncharacterized protein n=1 Tax=bioreactor metagenome TaxID=1076179 RepID=A0A645BKI9_9ZZZZ
MSLRTEALSNSAMIGFIMFPRRCHRSPRGRACTRAQPFRSIPLWQEPIRQSNLTIMPQPRPSAVIAPARHPKRSPQTSSLAFQQQRTAPRRAFTTGRPQSGPAWEPVGIPGRACETAPGKTPAPSVTRGVWPTTR